LNGFLQATNASIYCIWTCDDISTFPYSSRLTSSTTSTTSTNDSLKITTTPIENTFPLGDSIFQLGIQANTLVPSKSYVFQLKTTYLSNKNNLYATASVTIVLNAPPTGGSFATLPTQGFALTTIFNFNAFNWFDDASDYPLKYEFFYYLKSDSAYVESHMDLHVVKSSDDLSYTTSYVAQVFKV